MIVWVEAVRGVFVPVCIRTLHLVGTALAWIQTLLIAVLALTRVRKGRSVYPEPVSQGRWILRVVIYPELVPKGQPAVVMAVLRGLSMGYVPVIPVVAFIMMIVIVVVVGTRVWQGRLVHQGHA